jgi:hypothetical protein
MLGFPCSRAPRVRLEDMRWGAGFILLGDNSLAYWSQLFLMYLLLYYSYSTAVPRGPSTLWFQKGNMHVDLRIPECVLG